VPYTRPVAAGKLDKAQKVRLVEAMVEHHRRAFEAVSGSLNIKVPRDVFDDLLDEIGTLLLARSRTMAAESGPVREFLLANALPENFSGLLPLEFRAFCLALNGLKQWVTKEQAATDRYLLGGTARETCRAAATTCVVTGKSLAEEKIVLHHPLRDGRPPLPLSVEGHAKIEGQVRGEGKEPDTLDAKMRSLKKQMNKSWLHLHRGCLDHMGLPVSHSTPGMAGDARAFAKKVSVATGRSYREILDWLNENGLAGEKGSQGC